MKKRIILLFVFVLAGCGQRGPLFMPPDVEKNTPETSSETPETNSVDGDSSKSKQSS